MFGQYMHTSLTTSITDCIQSNLTLEPRIAVMSPLMQALEAMSQPIQPAPSPLIQSLINARDYRPSAAHQSQETAEESQPQAQQTQEHAEDPQPAAEQSQEPAEESQQQGQLSPEHAEHSPEHVQQSSVDEVGPTAHDVSATVLENDDDVSENDDDVSATAPENDEENDDNISPNAPEDVSSQGTVAPILTFGASTSTTSIVSSKAINRRTANDYAGTTGMVYSRPVPDCQHTITEAHTIERFYKHLDDNLHIAYFYQQSSHVCPFECHKGFLNHFALHRRIQQSLCEESETLLNDIRKCTQCNANRIPDITSALDHLSDDHEDLITSGSLYVCAPCGVGFPTKDFFWGHLALISQRNDTHPAVTKAPNMWYPAPNIVRS